MRLGTKVATKIGGIDYCGELVAVCNWKYIVHKNFPLSPDWINKDIGVIKLDKRYPCIDYVDFKKTRTHLYPNEEVMKAMWENSFIDMVQQALTEIKSCQ